MLSESRIASISAAGRDRCSPERMKKSLQGALNCFGFSKGSINSQAVWTLQGYSNLAPQFVQYGKPGGLDAPQLVHVTETTGWPTTGGGGDAASETDGRGIDGGIGGDTSAGGGIGVGVGFVTGSFPRRPLNNNSRATITASAATPTTAYSSR